MKLPKIVIFDVGGTLINGKLAYSVDLGYKYLYDHVLDVKESYEEYMKFVNDLVKIIKEREMVSLEFSFRSMFNYLSLTYGLKTLLSYEEIEDEFIKKFYNYECVDYVKELLAYLKSKEVKLAVFSNSMYSTNHIKEELRNTGILDYFESVSSSADYLVRKPSLAVFKLYLKKYGIMGYHSNEICYIGNMVQYDIYPVVSLKMMSVLKGEKFIYHDGYLEVGNYLELIKEFEKDEK